MGHLWTLGVFLFLWRCHASLLGKFHLQFRILYSSDFMALVCITFMHAKWRYMLVNKNRSIDIKCCSSKPLQATMWKRPARTVPLPAAVFSLFTTKSLQHGSDKLIVRFACSRSRSALLSFTSAGVARFCLQATSTCTRQRSISGS